MNFVYRKQITRIPSKIRGMFQEVKRKTSQWFHPKSLGEKMLRWKLNLFVTYFITGGGGKFSPYLAVHSPF